MNILGLISQLIGIKTLRLTYIILNNKVPMSEDGFNRQLKMAISILNNWRDFLKFK